MKKLSSSNYFVDKIKNNPALKAEIEDAQLSIDISMQLYTLRKELGITQKELALITDLQQSNIARLERPGYQGYTLKVLSKVVRALGARLNIEIIKNTSTSSARHDFLSNERNMSSLKRDTSIKNWGLMKEAKVYA